MPAWWIQPLVSGVTSLIGSNQQDAPPKYARTDDEQKMVDELQKKQREGFNVSDKLRQGARPIIDVGQHAKETSLGRAVGRGMEHSIITDELLRKQDRSTQKHLSNMAVQISQQNQAYKDKAEDKLHNFYQSEGDKKRGSDQQQTAFENQQSANQWGAFGSMMSSFAGGNPASASSSSFTGDAGQIEQAGAYLQQLRQQQGQYASDSAEFEHIGNLILAVEDQLGI
tara:strand:- start:3234 stop:3911 length:678 start_codon:yes stop_codon:yes gene_type:complete